MPEESDRIALENLIQSMEAQRLILGDSVVDTTISVIKEKLAALTGSKPVHNAASGLTGVPPGGQRKQVIVLIADVVGFTAISDGLDSARVATLMDTLWRRLDAVIQAREGLVYQHVGDALIAIWGVPVTRETDPEQAVRAGLDLQAELQAFNQSTGRVGQAELEMRVGIHSGPALIQPGDGPRGIVASGNPLGGADALQRSAPARSVLISHEVLRLVRGGFRVSDHGRVDFEGHTEPLRAYQVKVAYPRAFYLGIRDIEGIETHMIGRENELNLLQQAFHVMNLSRTLHTVMVSGEAGVGKSRLIYEFEKWIDLLPEPIWYFKGRASHEMQSLPYSLVRDLFAYRFQIQDSDRPAAVRQKIENGIAEVMTGGEDTCQRAHFIGHLLGIDFSDSPYLKPVLADSRQLRDRAIGYLREYFDAACALSPAVMLLEDVHWADDSSLDLLEELTRHSVGQRLLVVGATRPALFGRRPHWGDGQPGYLHIALQPLTTANARSLVEEILQRVGAIPASLCDLIVENTGGNPFYIEELIKMLVEDGVILKGEDTWKVEQERLTVVRVPATLEGVLQARLDSLPVAERGALQRAAVVGPVFWDDALSFIEGNPGATPGLTPLLDGLAAKEMVFQRHNSSFAQSREFMFKHSMLREVAYQGLLKKERRAYHARVAKWMETETSRTGREGEYSALIAEHYDQAGHVASAIEWYTRTGRQAAARFGNTEAVRCFSRALALATESGPATRFELLLYRERVLDLLGERLLQSGDLDDLEGLANLMGDRSRQANVVIRRANYYLMIGEYQRSTAAAQNAFDLAHMVADPHEAVDLEAQALLAWGHVLWRMSRYSESREKLENALRMARECGSLAIEAESLRLLGILSTDQGDFATSKTYYEQALNIYRKEGDRQGEANTLASLGNLSIDLGDHVAARAYHEQTLRIKRETGDRRGEGRALGNLGYIASDQGDYGASRTYFEKAITVFRAIGDRQGESVALVNLGSDSLVQGDYSSARSYQEKALLLQHEIGDRHGESIALDNLSLIHHHLNENQKALEYGQMAQEIMNEQGLRHLMGFALNHQGHALYGLGRLEEALTAYQRALDLRLELGEANLAAEARTGLARVYLEMGDCARALAQAKEVYFYLQTGSLDGMVEPFFVYLILHRVFQTAGDPTAMRVIQEAYERLQSRAEKIPDPVLRQMFLEKVPAHREIMEIYATMT